MKEKILYLVLGILIGAIITAGSFMLFKPKDNLKDKMQMKNPEGGATSGVITMDSVQSTGGSQSIELQSK